MSSVSFLSIDAICNFGGLKYDITKSFFSKCAVFFLSLGCTQSGEGAKKEREKDELCKAKVKESHLMVGCLSPQQRSNPSWISLCGVLIP